uniref:Uncharacterized protein n=1 Tax=Mycena chlorophos TaxID=658473 RepID=A0ABQ0L5T2_MYCCL|nr:predicted protein [Mycena chlorophos]
MALRFSRSAALVPSQAPPATQHWAAPGTTSSATRHNQIARHHTLAWAPSVGAAAPRSQHNPFSGSSSGARSASGSRSRAVEPAQLAVRFAIIPMPLQYVPRIADGQPVELYPGDLRLPTTENTLWLSLDKANLTFTHTFTNPPGPHEEKVYLQINRRVEETILAADAEYTRPGTTDVSQAPTWTTEADHIRAYEGLAWAMGTLGNKGGGRRKVLISSVGPLTLTVDLLSRGSTELKRLPSTLTYIIAMRFAPLRGRRPDGEIHGCWPLHIMRAVDIDADLTEDLCFDDLCPPPAIQAPPLPPAASSSSSMSGPRSTQTAAALFFADSDPDSPEARYQDLLPGNVRVHLAWSFY